MLASLEQYIYCRLRFFFKNEIHLISWLNNYFGEMLTYLFRECACFSQGSNQIGCWRIRRANICPTGGLKTGFYNLDKFSKSHKAKTGVLECAFSVVEICDEIEVQDWNCKSSIFQVNMKTKNTWAFVSWSLNCFLFYISGNNNNALIFSATDGDQFQGNLSMFQSLYILHTRVIYQTWGQDILINFLCERRTGHFFVGVFQNVKNVFLFRHLRRIWYVALDSDKIYMAAACYSIRGHRFKLRKVEKEWHAF